MKLAKTLLATVAVLALGVSAQAIPITGKIEMNGTAFLNSTLLGSATAVTSIVNSEVGGIPTGAYTGVLANTPVTWTGFSWPSNVAVNDVWTFAFGGRTYSFDLNSVAIVSQNNTFLNLAGTGTLAITGVGPAYDDTTGAWTFTISDAGGTGSPNFDFTFANSQTAVPDGGTTVVLLGLGMLGLAAAQRKFATA